nr:Arm DNA-binding domain-containing protein [Marinobacterium nitratireducens]
MADFDGLSLFFSAKGSKAWYFSYTCLGQRARISLGSYPELSLRDARQLRDFSCLSTSAPPHLFPLAKGREIFAVNSGLPGGLTLASGPANCA